MKRETLDGLLRETLATEQLDQVRNCSLEAMLRSAHRRRQRKHFQSLFFVFLPLLLLGAMVVQRFRPASVTSANTALRPVAPPATTSTMEGTKILSDDELFALFPGRPLALIGPPGQQRLVFLDQVQEDR